MSLWRVSPCVWVMWPKHSRRYTIQSQLIPFGLLFSQTSGSIINYMRHTWAKKHNASKFPFPDIFKHSKTTTNPPWVGRSQDLHQLLCFACFWWEGSVWSAATLKAGGRVPPSQTPVSVKCARWLNHHLAEGNQFLPENIWQPCSAAPSKLDNRDHVVPDDFMLVEPEARSQSATRRAKAQLVTKCSNTEILIVLFSKACCCLHANVRHILNNVIQKCLFHWRLLDFYN